jgi:hypothetical protein
MLHSYLIYLLLCFFAVYFYCIHFRYKLIVDGNEASGRGRKKWEYFEAMDELMAGDPSVHPAVTCGSIKGWCTYFLRIIMYCHLVLAKICQYIWFIACSSKYILCIFIFV